MKKAWVNFIKTFQPSYTVVVNMYHVIPGNPIQKYSHRHEFGKGEFKAAKFFYDRVVKKHTKLGFPNTEVHLIKGKKKVMMEQEYGPVDMVKNLNVQSA